MKNILFLTSFFVSVYSFTQNNTGEKTLKLEIRSTNTDHEIHRRSNDHKLERIELKREDRRDHTHKPTIERHHRPHLDGKRGDRPQKGDLKKERHHEKRNEQRQERRQEKRQEILQERKERRENKG